MPTPTTPTPRTEAEYFANLINEKLAGATIVGAYAVDTGYGETLALVVKVGNTIAHVDVSRDSEGNGPGALLIPHEMPKRSAYAVAKAREAMVEAVAAAVAAGVES